MKRNNKKGYSLLEVLIVIGIITSIIVSVFYFYPKLKNSNTVNIEVSNLNTILSGIYGIYNGNNYDGISNKLLIEAKIIPNTMVSNTLYKITNSWKGEVIISAYKVKNRHSMLSMKYTNIPQDQCALFVSSVEKNFGAIKTDVSYLQNNNQKTSFIKNSYKNMDLNIDNVAKGCSEKYNNITFYTK